MSVWAVIPAAGSGERFGGVKPKPLAELDGRPVIVRTLEAFEQSPLVQGIVLVVHRDWVGEYGAYVGPYGLSKVKAVVPGGDTRSQSVRLGLACLDPEVDVVMVHDGARPLVTAEIIAAGIRAAAETGAAIAAVRMTPTVKVVAPVTGLVTETLDRDLLWEVQTPQVFSRALLERAYLEDADGATDDAALVERLGARVKVFAGSGRNIKITTPDDMLIASAFLGC